MAQTISDYINWDVMKTVPPLVATAPPGPDDDTDAIEEYFKNLQRQQDEAARNARNAAAAAEARAKKAAKDQSAKENEATKSIVDSLFKSLGNFTSGRDVLLGNSQRTFDSALQGVTGQYQGALEDSDAFAARNAVDADTKSVANILNRVREESELMQQALAQGAGETDVLRTLQQAARNYDANQREVATTNNDNVRSISAQLAAASRAAATGRQNVFQQREEANAAAYNDWYKNMADTLTNIQRTEASNTNIDSDYSIGYQKQYGPGSSFDAGKEILKYVGKTYQTEAPDFDWVQGFAGRRDRIENPQSNRMTILSGPVKKAEGATVRNW